MLSKRVRTRKRHTRRASASWKPKVRQRKQSRKPEQRKLRRKFMKTKVLTLDNKAAGEIELDEAIFGVTVRNDLLHRAVEWQRSKARSGNHKTKTISEISGTTKKPW